MSWSDRVTHNEVKLLPWQSKAAILVLAAKSSIWMLEASACKAGYRRRLQRKVCVNQIHGTVKVYDLESMLQERTKDGGKLEHSTLLSLTLPRFETRPYG